MGLRFLRFNVVSGLGIGVRLLVVCGPGQLGWACTTWSATAIAIEASILHNFFWHLHWTWGPSVATAAAARLQRTMSSSAAWRSTRATAWSSFLGAMVLMPMLVGSLGLHYLVANVITVCFTGLLNFFLGDRLVFRPMDRAAPSQGQSSIASSMSSQRLEAIGTEQAAGRSVPS